MSISIEQFQQEAHNEIDRFVAWYLKEHSKNPEWFPLEVPNDNSGIWWDQLSVFGENDINDE